MRAAPIYAAALIGLFDTILPAVGQVDRSKARILTTVFDQPRSDKEDVIFFRNRDVLRGTVLNSSLGIDTPYGAANVELRKCAGVSFEGSRANTEALVTVNRNRLTGIISHRTIKFRIGSSGEEIEVRKEKIQFILLQRSANELDFLQKAKSRDLFVMANGDLLTGKPEPPKLTVTTDYGAVAVAFDEIRKVEMQGGENVTAVITKKNNDVMRGSLETEEITLKLDLGVNIEKVYKDKLATIFVEHVPDEMLRQFGQLQPVKGESVGAVGTDTPPGDRPRELKLELGQGVVLEMVLIPAGEFDMGSPVLEEGREENEPLHRVRITKPFYMAKYETTQAEWLLVMGEDPANFKGMRNPVEQVSWLDCQKYLEKLGQFVPGKRFRLPTEAEWEYSCRAGAATRFSFGDSEMELSNFAWYESNSGKTTHAVGGKHPNAFGLHDMHGNVWEWCADWYGKYQFANGATISDPVGPSIGDSRVLRGGAWLDVPRSCRAADRQHGYSPGHRHYGFGLRVVLDLN